MKREGRFVLSAVACDGLGGKGTLANASWSCDKSQHRTTAGDVFEHQTESTQFQMASDKDSGWRWQISAGALTDEQGVRRIWKRGALKQWGQACHCSLQDRDRPIWTIGLSQCQADLKEGLGELLPCCQGDIPGFASPLA